MKQNYTEFTSQDFLLDEAFIRSVYGPKEGWDRLQKDHPEKLSEMHRARDILLSMSFYEDRIEEHQIRAIADKVKERIGVKVSEKSRVVSLSFIYKIAASVIILASIGFGISRFVDFNEENVVVIPLVNKSNPRGQKSTIALPDGSTVVLNSESEITFLKEFKKDVREVWVKGEAFFDVKRNEEAPFVVYTGALKATVLGTSFNVRNYSDETFANISLSTGRLLVAPVEANSRQDPGIELKPGRQANYDKSLLKIKEDFFDTEEVLSWKNKTIYFKQADMITIKKKLERWYGVEIVFENQLQRKVSLSTTFSDQSLSSVLKSLAFTLKFDYQMEKEKVVIQFK